MGLNYFIDKSSCYSQPSKPINGFWNCDEDLTSCNLQCEDGFILQEPVIARYTTYINHAV